MKQIQNRKSLTLKDAYPAVLAVAVVAMLVVVLIYFFASFQTGLGSTNSRSVINETLTSVQETGEYVSNYTACNWGSFAVTQALNATDGVLIPAANYTVSANGLVAYSGVAGRFNNTNWLVTYTYTDGGSACDAASSTSGQFVSVVPLIGLVLVIVFIGIVIGILIYSFKGRRA
jgi:hypothetical protein